MVDCLERCRAKGVRYAAGEAAAILYTNKDGKKDAAGVATKDGQKLYADFVILATGAWTSKLLPDLGSELLATGQTVGTIQLTKDEARQAPVQVGFVLDAG